MEQMKKKDQQRTLLDEIDYIDIPAFFRSMIRYVRKYIILVLPLIICMSVCLSILTKPYTRRDYVAGGTAMIGLRLSNSLSFDYTLSGLTWDRQSTLANLNYILNALVESGYITQFVKDSMGKKRNEELNGQIYLNVAYSTNLIDIYVVSESLEDAEIIRDAVITCLPDAVFPALGFIEMDLQKLYTREEVSPRASLASYKVWVAGGAISGILGYLGLVFLYTLRRRDVETPKDLHKLTNLSCIGRLPALKKRIRIRERSNTNEFNDYFVVTKEYQRAFNIFRRKVSEEILQHQIRVLLLTGTGHNRGQSTIVSELEKEWCKMGKKVIVTDPSIIDGLMTEEKVYRFLNEYFKEADIILIDGPACDQSADILILADCADAMITIIREGQSQPNEIKEMFQSLQNTNAKPLGYILNMCNIM